MTQPHSNVAAVLIGRNEGQRLVAALAAATRDVARVVYVDSGSTDDSVAAARAVGAEVVALDMSVPFTAARARNAGYDHIVHAGSAPDFIQFIDGDCALRTDWVASAVAFLSARPDMALVAGRVRERYPEATVWNGICDKEWDLPVGETKTSGGIFMIRTEAFRQVGGFDAALIAGEEPELCLRLADAGWRMWRLADEMVWHDAAMTQMRQYLRRCRRAGHTYAEGVAMYGKPPHRYRQTELRRAIGWGLALPILAVLGAIFVTPWALGLFALYGVQMIRAFGKSGDWRRAALQQIAKPAEALGALGYWWDRWKGRRTGLIEYK